MQYNRAVWPSQLGLIGIGVVCVIAGLAELGWARTIPWALACLWAWMAIAYRRFVGVALVLYALVVYPQDA